jgi:hypothetical protein
LPPVYYCGAEIRLLRGLVTPGEENRHDMGEEQIRTDGGMVEEGGTSAVSET